jgi:hypothetical protein
MPPIALGTFPEQLPEPRDVDGDPSRLVVREHLYLSGVSLGRGRKAVLSVMHASR